MEEWMDGLMDGWIKTGSRRWVDGSKLFQGERWMDPNWFKGMDG